METQKSTKKEDHSRKQSSIVRFRAATELQERLKKVAAEEEMSVGALVRKFVVSTLDKFPR